MINVIESHELIAEAEDVNSWYYDVIVNIITDSHKPPIKLKVGNSNLISQKIYEYLIDHNLMCEPDILFINGVKFSPILSFSFKEAKDKALKNLEKFSKICQQRVERENDIHNQEIKSYIEKAVADIARKCGVNQDEVWAEMEYWSRSKA